MIRGSWGDAIKILDVGYASERDPQPEGTPYVLLGCQTEIACYQAMLSIADHARNDLSDWESRWQPVNDFRYALRVWDPVENQRKLD